MKKQVALERAEDLRKQSLDEAKPQEVSVSSIKEHQNLLKQKLSELEYYKTILSKIRAIRSEDVDSKSFEVLDLNLDQSDEKTHNKGRKSLGVPEMKPISSSQPSQIQKIDRSQIKEKQEKLQELMSQVDMTTQDLIDLKSQ